MVSHIYVMIRNFAMSSLTQFCTFKSILIINSDIEYLETQHNDAPARHCHWCVMEIVSSVIQQLILAV